MSLYKSSVSILTICMFYNKYVLLMYGGKVLIKCFNDIVVYQYFWRPFDEIFMKNKRWKIEHKDGVGLEV